jgi:hypothetical protein
MSDNGDGVVGRCVRGWTIEAMDKDNLAFRFDFPNGSCVVVELDDDGQARIHVDETDG